MIQRFRDVEIEGLNRESANRSFGSGRLPQIPQLQGVVDAS